ncbi:hypothetical protein ACFL1I_06915 [Candidatus Omnitrophota bacterium]
MLQIVVVFGLIKIVGCLVALVKPDFLRKTIDFFLIGSRLYVVGTIRLILGGLLLILATQARWWGFVVVFGLLAAASGILFFFLALKRTKILLKRLQTQPERVLRVWVMICIAIWLILIYSLLPVTPGPAPY